MESMRPCDCLRFSSASWSAVFGGVNLSRYDCAASGPLGAPVAWSTMVREMGEGTGCSAAAASLVRCASWSPVGLSPVETSCPVCASYVLPLFSYVLLTMVAIGYGFTQIAYAVMVLAAIF